MEYIRGPEDHLLLFPERIGVLTGAAVLVVKVAFVIPVDLHLVRHERIKPEHITFAVSDDLCVGIPPKEQMAHERFTKDEVCK